MSFMLIGSFVQISGIASGIFSIVSYVPYIKDIFRLKAKPEKASWFIWTVLVFIQFFSQLNKGAQFSLWLSGSQLVGITLISLLSIKFGYGKFHRKDYYALLLSGIGILAWYFTKEAAIALIITIGIDSVGGILTVQKAYIDPKTEPPAMWAMNLFAGVFACLAVGRWDGILLLYPIYTVILNSAVLLARFFGSRRLLSAKVIK